MAAETNLVDLIDRFGDEDRCRDYLEKLRWPDGVTCPRCGSSKIVHVHTRNQYTCKGRWDDGTPCRYRFSVRAGTIFQDSKLSLTKWFLAVYIIGESKKGVSAQQLSRMLHITTKTSWFLCHRIREAMNEHPDELLNGTVEVDETFVGGKRRGSGGRGSGRDKTWTQANKTMVVGAVQRDGEVRLRIGRSRDGKELGDFIRDMISADATNVYTDDLRAYNAAGIGQRHASVNHSDDEWVRGDVHTQTIESVWSLFKRSIIGSYHHLSVKHLPRYLDELEFRYNNRDNRYLFRDTLLALLHSENLTYEALVS